MPLREASRCIKILENISLRGVFWPGACAAAIKDLQQALQKKIGTDASGSRGGNMCRRYDIQMPLNGLNQTRQSLPRQDNHVGSISSSSIQPSAIDSQNSGAQSQFRNSSNPVESTQGRALDLAPNGSSNSRTRPILPLQNPATFTSAWPSLDGESYEMNEQFNGFDDIFQLIDVPFHLSDHGYQASTQTSW
jgi:hypothetical protein